MYRVCEASKTLDLAVPGNGEESVVLRTARVCVFVLYLFSDKPPPFDGIWASGSGNNTTGETFSFRGAWALFVVRDMSGRMRIMLSVVRTSRLMDSHGHRS